MMASPNQRAPQCTYLVAICTAVVAIVLSHAADVVAADAIDFNRDIRPILSDKCFQCHGPDADSREAELRLDRRDDAIANRDGAAAVIPNRPDDSSLIERINESDDELRMPPPSTKKKLSKHEIDLMTRWIREGAPFDEHWAFLPVTKPEPPEVRNSAWVRNPIDRFVLAKLEAQSIAASPLADQRTIIKRIHIDLIGLLPTAEATAKYLALMQRDVDAGTAQMVDELLASDHYAERWARHWLDQARFADSNGYTIDGDRVMWPYRDWVIRAIRDDMPFDQFTIEQLAGDLLENPTKLQLLATGFHRNTLINQEGGTDPEQFRNEAVVDRVNTTGAVWLGLTTGCAQCHNHKFDPFSQKEFYELFAFFNHGQDRNNTGPTVRVAENELFATPSSQHLAALEQAKDHVAKLDKSKGEREKAWVKSQSKKIGKAAIPKWEGVTLQNIKAEGGSKTTLLDDGSLLASKGATKEVYSVELATTASVAALRMRVLPHDSLPKNGPGLAGNGNFVLSRLELWQGEHQIAFARAQASHAQPGFPIEKVLDDDASTGWAINVGKGTPKGTKMNAEHSASFVLEKPLSPSADKPLRLVLRHEVNAFYNIGRFAIDQSPFPPPPNYDSQLVDAIQTASEKRTKEQKQKLTAEFAKQDTQLAKARAAVAKARKQLGYGTVGTSMILRELAKPRETFLHIRGDFLRHDKTLGPLHADTPDVLPPLSNDSTDPNRLDLAKWLVSPSNPLTPRVTVNRIWMRFFGRGIVETENDFGSQGSPPSHPLLLDWLSAQLIEGGWSMKRLHRTIVMSATYRQSSHFRNDLVERDADNRLFGRQNRLRFDAEIIRDAALSASGRLNPKIGGPSVRPPQPEGVYAFTQQKKNWATETGPDRFRRAMYTKFYRSAPYPMLTTFDSPDFQSTCTRRPRSNTPLQSLTLANDKSFIEFAQNLGRRVLQSVSSKDPDAQKKRIELAFQLCYCRPPSDIEATIAAEFLNDQQAQFKADSDAAKKVAPANLSDDVSLPLGAAWTALARGLMNTDEFITRE